MKRIFLAILMLVATVSFAQKVSFNTDFYNAGVGFTGYWSDVDSWATADSSALTYTSEYFDITPIDGQTLYMTYNFYTSGNTNDSLILYIQGVWGDGTMALNLDTVILVGTNTSLATQVVPSITAYAPMVRVSFVQPTTGAFATKNAQNGKLRLNFYARANDVIYKWNKNWYK